MCSGISSKDPEFRDDLVNPNFQDSDPPFKRLLPIHSADHPVALDIATEMRHLLDEYPGDRVADRRTVPAAGAPVAYYGPDLTAVHLPFNFSLLWAAWSREKWAARGDFTPHRRV